MSLMHLLIGQDRKAARRRPPRAHYRPLVESMEDRLVLSATGSASALLAPVQLAKTTQTVSTTIPLTISGINLTSITQASSGVITATGTITGSLLNHNFTSDVTAILTPAASPTTCPVLDLQIAPIHLSLLGANVDTSAICLDITATQGGGLLGNLLCGSGAGSLTGLLGGLTGGTLDLSGVLSGLDTLLNDTTLLGGIDQLLGQATANFGSPAVSSTAGQTCNVLNLSLGPVDLSLLGLNVSLDNCANGPITVTITATQGGGLLGDLLCGLAGVLNARKPNASAVNNLLQQIVTVVESL